ncbi:hypothetical protein ACFQ7B_43930 [Streptomyces erythrochromogenes]|uniref:hypothetical protein n=1 Tax=Streptomyces erythrochromogenes TaxID=285574 RepID=UPI0036C7243E
MRFASRIVAAAAWMAVIAAFILIATTPAPAATGPTPVHVMAPDAESGLVAVAVARPAPDALPVPGAVRPGPEGLPVPGSGNGNGRTAAPRVA